MLLDLFVFDTPWAVEYWLNIPYFLCFVPFELYVLLSCKGFASVHLYQFVKDFLAITFLLLIAYFIELKLTWCASTFFM